MLNSPQADILRQGLPRTVAEVWALALDAWNLAQSNTVDIEIIGAGIISGTVDPEGVVTAAVGTMYQNRTTKQYWTKDSGSGNTGWLPAFSYEVL